MFKFDSIRSSMSSETTFKPTFKPMPKLLSEKPLAKSVSKLIKALRNDCERGKRKQRSLGEDFNPLMRRPKQPYLDRVSISFCECSESYRIGCTDCNNRGFYTFPIKSKSRTDAD